VPLVEASRVVEEAFQRGDYRTAAMATPAVSPFVQRVARHHTSGVRAGRARKGTDVACRSCGGL